MSLPFALRGGRRTLPAPQRNSPLISSEYFRPSGRTPYGSSLFPSHPVQERGPSDGSHLSTKQ